MVNAKHRAYADALEAEKARLFQLADAELRSLPDYSEVKSTADGQPFTIALWHDHHTDGFDVFVAQAKHDIALGIGRMFVRGFILRADGSRDGLPDDVFYEYA